MSPLLLVHNLSIAFGGSVTPAVSELGLSIEHGERLALVGESGSGKTATALALLGLLPASAVVSGKLDYAGATYDLESVAALRGLRGREFGIVFQEPMTSLNPVLSIGEQLTEAPRYAGRSKSASFADALDMLERVGIDDPKRRLKQYPHEFSGGMRQRVMIAMAMMLRPKLLIADEPTTALDVTVQAQVLRVMTQMTQELGSSLLLITHDMGVVAENADRVMVLRGGRVLEEQLVAGLFVAPREPYTRQLLAAVPRHDSRPAEAGIGTPAILALDSVSKRFAGSSAPAVDGVSLEVGVGETLALVGESGSGKSTLGRIAARLVAPDTGHVILKGEDITTASGAHLRRLRRAIQLVFQDPYASLDPRRSIGQSVGEPIAIAGGRTAREIRSQAHALLERVGLDAAWASRLPHQLSGGQRQRVAIARALAANPDVLIADEPTSALDVSIQAEILQLLADLQREHRLALLFITHDLAVVRKVAQRIAVMRSGRILELGSAARVLSRPAHPYTQALLSAAPIADPAQRDRTRLAVPEAGVGRPLQLVAAQHWVAL